MPGQLLFHLGSGHWRYPCSPLEGSTSPSEACLGLTLCPFFGLYAGVLIGSDGRSTETQHFRNQQTSALSSNLSPRLLHAHTHSLSSSSKLKNQARSKVSGPHWFVAVAISPRDQGSTFLCSVRDTEGNGLSPKEIRSCQGIVVYLFFK